MPDLQDKVDRLQGCNYLAHPDRANHGHRYDEKATSRK